MNRAQVITATASCRADLAGGTLDIWPLYLFHEGAVTVNVALSVLTHCELRPLRGRSIVLESKDTGREDRFAGVSELLAARRYRHPLAGHLCRYFLSQPGAPRGGFQLSTDSESPAGAGISGSSALMIAATAVLARYCGVRMGKEEMRVVAQNVEAQLIRVPTGCQDYYPALYGGVSAIHLTPGGTKREGIAVPPEEMNRRFVLAYTGKPRQSGTNNWEVFKAHIGGDRKVHRNFEEIAAIARGMHSALLGQDWDEVARLLREEWRLRKTNAPGISTPRIERLMAAARRNGCIATKVCGAGGGGCVLLQVEPGAKARVEQALRESGGEVLPFRVANFGVVVSSR
ncbi:MAG: GHMP kinase [Acidobacteriales bacterium]|nr:GHMP kinase [Terriglobales bacterium]